NAGDDRIVDDLLGGGTVNAGPGADSLILKGTAGADAVTAFNDRVTLGTSATNVVTYAAVESLTVQALAGNDALTTSLTAGGPTATLDGGLGTDSIAAGDVDATWTVTGRHAGTVDTGTVVSYTDVESVRGGQRHDTLIVLLVPVIPLPPGPPTPPP